MCNTIEINNTITNIESYKEKGIKLIIKNTDTNNIVEIPFNDYVSFYNFLNKILNIIIKIQSSK